MIINGGSRRNGRFFANHLTNGEHNERVTLCELRNLAAQNIADALREMEAVAMGTLCTNYFYHVNINPRQEEPLTAQQWQTAVETLELNLDLSGHARFVVEHQKQGRTHRHAIWSRINVNAMRAVEMTDDYAKHQATARQLEQAFGLASVDSVHDRTQASGPRPPRRPKAWESFRGQKSGIDPHAMTQFVTRLYRASKSGSDFAARLAEHGYRLVQGNSAEFCILDEAEHLHSLARRIEGIKAASLKAFMTGVAVAPLPA